ncbi:hypothetical protein HDU76_002689 [Blyttiomyces sp. JEL0837]|nr:hypothetical protein HDU76_002689 [Blyttiomyces sp. JEL0837]
MGSGGGISTRYTLRVDGFGSKPAVIEEGLDGGLLGAGSPIREMMLDLSKDATLRKFIVKVTNFFSHSYEINLALTGVVARLAAAPIPILYMYLFSADILLGPNYTSLFTVLIRLRREVEERRTTIPNFEEALANTREQMFKAPSPTASSSALKATPSSVSGGPVDWLKERRDRETSSSPTADNVSHISPWGGDLDLDGEFLKNVVVLEETVKELLAILVLHDSTKTAKSKSATSSETSPSTSLFQIPKMRTRSTSNPTPSIKATAKPGVSTAPGLDTVPGSSNAINDEDPSAATAGTVAAMPQSASVSAGGVGFLGMRRRGASANNTNPISQSGSPSNSHAKLLIHSHSFNAGVISQRSPSVASSIASSISAAGVQRSLNNASPIPSSGGRSISFAEFRKFDSRPRHQRLALYSLQKLDYKLRLEARNKGVKDLKKPFKEPKFKEEKGRKGFGKLGGLLQKKKKKRTRAVLDQKTTLACTLLDDVSSAAVRKKQPLLANRAFLTAITQSMESVCLIMLDKGFPVSVNTPVVLNKANIANTPSSPTKGSVPGTSAAAISANNAKGAPGKNMPPLELPSYFMVALSLGLDHVVRSMIKRADVNQTWHGLTPLHLAACKNSIALTQVLLEHGADPGVGILLSQYCLLRRLKSASYSPRPAGSPTRASNPSSPSPSRWARATGFAVLRQAGSTAEDPGKRKKTYAGWPEEFANQKKILPVEMAAACGHWDLVRYLLSKMDQKSLISSSFALLIQRDAELTTLFIRAGVPTNQKDAYGSNALHLAVRSGDLEVAQALIAAKINVNSKGQNDWTPLHEAVSMRRAELVRVLLRAGADPEATNGAGESPRALGLRVGLTPEEIEEMFTDGTGQPVNVSPAGTASLTDSSTVASASPTADSPVDIVQVIPRRSVSPNALPGSKARRSTPDRLAGMERFPSLPSFLSRNGSGVFQGGIAAAGQSGSDSEASPPSPQMSNAQGEIPSSNSGRSSPVSMEKKAEPKGLSLLKSRFGKKAEN